MRLLTPSPPVRARILGNLGLPEVEGFSIRHFGHYLAPGSPPWRPEMERRNLSEILPLIPAAEKPDILVCGSPEYLPIPWDIHTFPGTKVLLITDWNVCLRFLPDICPLFDFCFVDWPGYRLLRKARLSNVHHQPLFGHDPRRFRFLDKPRDLDVSFCGNLNSGLHGERNRLLARVAWWADRTRRSVHLRQAFGDPYIDVLNRSRLVFNYSIRGEANMRLFEAMACGAVPLVEDTNQEAAILFQEGRHYFRYAPGQLEEKLDELLAQPERVAAVAEEARREVARYTKARQIENLLETVLRETPSRRGLPGETPPNASRKALAKIRILGMGYTAKEAIEEIQSRAKECPGLDIEALPGLLFAVMEREVGPAREAARRALEYLLGNPNIPQYLRIFLRLQAALQFQDSEAASSLAEEFLLAMEKTELSQMKPGGSLYGFLLPPVDLGKGMNSDLTKSFLSEQQGEESGNARRFLSLHGHYATVKASMDRGQPAYSTDIFLNTESASLSSIPVHKMRLAAAVLAGDTQLILENCKIWFQASPLDTQAWDEIFRAYEKVDNGEKRQEFLNSIRILAVYFLDAQQAERIKTLAHGAK